MPSQLRHLPNFTGFLFKPFSILHILHCKYLYIKYVMCPFRMNSTNENQGYETHLTSCSGKTSERKYFFHFQKIKMFSIIGIPKLIYIFFTDLILIRVMFHDSLLIFYKYQFSSVTQSCPTLCGPMNRSTPGLPVHHHLPEFTQTHSDSRPLSQ